LKEYIIDRAGHPDYHLVIPREGVERESPETVEDSIAKML